MTGRSRFGRGRGCTGRGFEGDENIVIVLCFVELSGEFVATFLEGYPDASCSGKRGTPARFDITRHDV